MRQLSSSGRQILLESRSAERPSSEPAQMRSAEFGMLNEDFKTLNRFFPMTLSFCRLILAFRFAP
jgi:hypothetical protein